MEQWKKETNAKWLEEMKQLVADGGTWIWKDTGYKYTLIDGKFVGEHDEATKALQEILPDGYEA